MKAVRGKHFEGVSWFLYSPPPSPGENESDLLGPGVFYGLVTAWQREGKLTQLFTK